MTTILLATGVLGFSDAGQNPVGNVTTPTERTIRFTRAGANFSASQNVDPSDVMDFVLDLTPMLAPDEQFASVTLVTLPAATALGFQVMSSAPYAPVEVENGKLRIWVTVADAQRSSDAWRGGTACQLQVTATTNSDPARTFQRTAAITVAQK